MSTDTSLPPSTSASRGGLSSPYEAGAVFSSDATSMGPLTIEDDVALQTGERLMTLNMGPQHPSTHGVLRVVLKLDGELIVDCDPVIGYLHRGTEKLGEHHRYAQIIPWTDRTDYVAAPMNNLGCVLAIEKLCGVTAPERAQYWRVIMSELARIASHLVWLGTHALDIGALSRPIPENLPGMVRDFLQIFPERQQEYADLLTANPIWMARTKGVGVIPADAAINYSLTGACLRGSGVNYDIRKAMPYCVYDRLDFEVPLGQHGDTYDRYLVRMEEMRQTIKIIGQALDQCERMDTELMDWDSEYVIPPHKGTMTTAEDMQRHFIWVIKGFSPPVGEVYTAVEGPKGELGYYIVSDGSPLPYRFRIRAPDFVNLSVLPYMANGSMLADVVALIGTIDIVLGSVDR